MTNKERYKLGLSLEKVEGYKRKYIVDFRDLRNFIDSVWLCGQEEALKKGRITSRVYFNGNLKGDEVK